MMVTLLVFAYSVGIRSSRKIAAACERNLAFRAIVGNDRPDFRTISDFRKIHLAAFRPLFLEVLRLAGGMGMVKLGNLSTDGTKMGANASRHKERLEDMQSSFRVLADLVDGSVMFAGLPLTVAPPHDRRHDPLHSRQGGRITC